MPMNQPLLRPENVKLVLDAHENFLRVFADLDNVRPFAYKRLRQWTTIDEEERPGPKMHPGLVVQDRLRCYL